MMAKVEIYTTAFCPYCTRAKSLLKSKGIQFEEHDVMMRASLRRKMSEMAGGRYICAADFCGWTAYRR